MFFNAPDAVSFAGGVDLGAIVGGAFQKGKIYGLTGSIRGQSTSFVDSGLGFEVGGAASLNISEYYFVNLSGKDYTLSMDDFSGQRFSINAGASVVISLGFGLSIAPVGGGWDSGMYIISKTYAYGAGIEGLPVNANYGQTKTYK